MADLKTQKQLNEAIKEQKSLLEGLEIGSKKYLNTQKEIVLLEEKKKKLLADQKKIADDVSSDQVNFASKFNKLLAERKGKEQDLAKTSGNAAKFQQGQTVNQINLLKSIEKQVGITKKTQGETNEETENTFKALQNLVSEEQSIESIQKQIEESKARQNDLSKEFQPMLSANEKGFQNILESELYIARAKKLSGMASEKGLKVADDLSGGMVSKAKDFGKNMGMSPKNLARLGIAGLIIGVLVKAVTGFSKKIDAVGETFGFMTNTNKEFRNDLIDSGNEAMMVGKNLGDVLAVTSQLSSEFGITLKESQDIAGTVLDTAVATGISNDEATKLFGTFMKIGGLTSDQAENLIESTAQLAAQKGVAPKAVLQDMASSAEEIAGFTKGTGENIAEAAVQARQMGLSLSTTAKIAEGLLDFESSIANEIEASVMIGRQLNFQKARQLALDGDIAGATKDIVSQLGSEAEFNKLNFLQRKSLAKSIGVSVTEMKKLVSASDKLTLSGALAGEKFDDLVGQDALSGLTSIINSLKMVGAAVMDEIGKPIAEMLKTFQESLMTPEGMKTFKNDIIGVINGFTGFINGLMSFAEIFVWGDLARIAKIPQVNDFKSGPGGITHMMGPAGAFSLNPRDSVLATTNRINDGFITGDEGSFANFKELVEAQDVVTGAAGSFANFFKELVEAQRDSVVATTNPIPVNDFSLNPRDSVMGTTNRINDFQTGPAGSMGAGLSDADASRIGKAMASNMRFETTVTNRQQQIIIDGALNPLGGRPITA